MIDLRKEYKDYLGLLSILVFGLVGFVYFGYDRQLQGVVVVTTALFYVVWGVVHHLLREDFHLKVLLEYLAVAFFASALLLALLGRI